MKIIILGAGQVGRTVASNLAREDNDITIVDTNASAIQELKEKLDVRTIIGMASHPGVLQAAGAEDADMVIAVTNSDEVNMVVCQISYTLFHVPTKIARVRSTEYLDHDNLFVQEALPIDVLISPEQLMTRYVYRLIQHAGVLQVLNFAEGRVQLASVKAYYGGPLIGKPLGTFSTHIPKIKSRVAAIFRRGRAIIPNGNTIIEPEDEVFFIAAPEHIYDFASELRKIDKPYKRIIIAGGGNIGSQLAHVLENNGFHVKIIEKNPERTQALVEALDRTIVLEGNAADEDLLLEENIENTDVFCALTNDDETNILSAMLAKQLGTRRVMALINRPSYASLVESNHIIDVAISPQDITIGALLRHIRRGDIVSVHSLRHGAAEAIEAVAHGDYHTSNVVGRRIEEIRLPPSTTIGAIVRNEKVLIAHHNTLIQAGDHVILFLSDKRQIQAVEKLFQVGLTFL